MTTRTRGASSNGAPLSVLNILGRLVALAVIDAVALAFGYGLVAGGLWIGAVVLLVITAIINVAFLVDRLYPLRWISPGLLLLVLMVVYPLLYTGYIAFTNYGQGHILSKQQVIDRLEADTYTSGTALTWRAYRSPAGNFLLWLTDEAGTQLLGDATTGQIQPVDPADPRFGPIDPEDRLPTRIDDYEKLPRLGTIRYLTILEDVRLQSEVNGELADIRITSLDAAELGQQKYTYDAARDVLVDNETGVEYVDRQGFFTAPDGTQLSPGFSAFIGPANFLRVFTDDRIRGPFLGVFIWTFAFAALTVIFAFAVGLGLALVLNDRHLPAKGLFRTLSIIPYTIPGFISALVWVGLLNPLHGPINGLLEDVVGVSPRWFSDGTLAKVALLTINTWLGYPYMLLVSLGALQSIPSEIYEAAQIDGASPVQRFRSITFPLLLVALA
ncbi:MAG TPA: ABC transporter permease subunit, partial [Candidatus Caenarcaniphilales bacterium]|nr:ABC transporter permease subunit [Candidatus Caenarcaniphilales bacterium]